jgi:uncharacterized protein (DUF2345 family)
MVIDDGGGAAPPPASLAKETAKYSGAFRAVDETTGAPIAGLPYRIELPDGSTVRGVTDDDGHTACITSDNADTIKLSWEADASDE